MASNSKTPRPANTRARAALCVEAVLGGRSLDVALAHQQEGLSTEDQRFLQHLCYGVLRDWLLLQSLVRSMLDKPPRQSARLIEILLCVGLYQLRSMQQPPRAAVHSTVQATRDLRVAWASGLVNALLRRYLREADSLMARLPDDPLLHHAHPDWLGEAIHQDWPDQWLELLQANQQPGPLWLRVNPHRTSRDAYLARLQTADIQASPCRWSDQALQLTQALPVSALPDFADGAVSVQDAAAQLAAGLLDSQPGMRVLDACAAPGGKTAHLLESTASLKLLALDKDTERLQRVAENLQRLGLNAAIQSGDAANPEDWWDGQPFDRILLDAPCSGTGVIRRHPDIKWLRREEDIAALAAEQGRMLRALWPTLAPGGQLLYATCSVLAAEGDAVIDASLPELEDVVVTPIEAAWGHTSRYGRRIATGQDGMDGFYYALLTKQSVGIA